MRNVKKMIKRIAAALTILSVLGGCSPQRPKVDNDKKQTSDKPEKLSIVATIFPQYDFSRQLAGDLADITLLVEPGEEIHTFEPTPQDIIKIQNADIFIYAGGESESWVDGILGSFDTKDIEIINMMDICDTVEEETVEGMETEEQEQEEKETADAEPKEMDEHVWMSIDNAQVVSQAITDALCEVDEENSAVYIENCEKYLSSLSSLKKRISQTVSGGARDTIVFGDRFPARYFADEFGLEYYAAFPGCAEQSEPSAGTVAFLIEKVREEEIPVVFKIEMSNGKVAETIAQSTDAEVLTFNSCHTVSMKQFLDGVTYIQLMEQNCEALEKALY